MQKIGTGKIYKIVSNECEKVYIGSTFERTLNIRFSKHKHDLKRWRDGRFRFVSSFDIIKYPDAKIIELSTFDNISKKELLKYEDDFIKNNNTVNIKRPFRQIDK